MRRGWCWNWLFCRNDVSGRKTFETTTKLATGRATISALYPNVYFFMGSLYTCNALLPLLRALILCIRNSKNAVVCVWPRNVWPRNQAWALGPVSRVLYTVGKAQGRWPVHAILIAALSDTGTLPIWILRVIQWLSLNQKETNFDRSFPYRGNDRDRDTRCPIDITGLAKIHNAVTQFKIDNEHGGNFTQYLQSAKAVCKAAYAEWSGWQQCFALLLITLCRRRKRLCAWRVMSLPISYIYL